MTVIGIDPGLTGGIAILDIADGLIVHDMPVCDGAVDAYALAALITDAGPLHVAAVEAVHSMPKQGVASTFKFGRGYGTVIGVLAALQRPVIHVPPTKWCRALSVGADKDAHRSRAMDLWPTSADRFTRKRDDGRADAALIAYWAANYWDEARRAS